MLLRRLRMRGRSAFAVVTATTLFELPPGVGVTLRSRSTGCIGLDGIGIGKGGGAGVVALGW
jgi:hypothetical protein